MIPLFKIEFLNWLFFKITFMIYGLDNLNIPKNFKIILFGMWLVCAKIWYTYTYYTNGNDFVSQKWLKMTNNVWSDVTEKQQNGIWAVFEIWLLYVLV